MRSGVAFLACFSFSFSLLLPSRAWTLSFLPPRTTSSLTMATTNQESATASSTARSNPLPNLPLPDPIYSDTPGTWAFDTMSRRVDSEILQRTAQDNEEEWSKPAFATIKDNFIALRDELQNAATTRLTHLEAPKEATAERVKEHTEWTTLLAPFINDREDTWLTAPWMVTEFYVYRRLMQAIQYWDSSSPGYKYDPFHTQKYSGLVSSVASAEAVLARIPTLPRDSAEGIELAASIALWGNKMDLSLWPADASKADQDIFSSILETASENLLHDDSRTLSEHCEKLRLKGGGAVDIIVDNAGFELITDLALAQFLIQSGIASVVTFQLKSHPTFVSDALEKDLVETVEYYEQLDSSKYPSSQSAGALWKEFLDSGKWKCNEDNFWVQPFAMWEMTEPLRSDMAGRCDLAFVKGDANYRRLLGDRLWDLSAPFQDVVGCYFPCPVCALRTLKAELGCGMDPQQVERAVRLDDNWMVNGRFGVVQFGTP